MDEGINMIGPGDNVRPFICRECAYNRVLELNCGNRKERLFYINCLPIIAVTPKAVSVLLYIIVRVCAFVKLSPTTRVCLWHPVFAQIISTCDVEFG